MKGLEVFRSQIHGYGVRTTAPFREGDLVLYGDGVLYRDSDDFDDTYALITPGYELDENGDEGPPMYWDLACQSRWINHSCDPNTAVETEWKADERAIVAWWTALRDIEPGEELSYDYAFSAEVAEICRCGALSCRGLIVDPEEVDSVADHLKRYLRGVAA